MKEVDRLYYAIEPFLGSRILEIGCGGGQFAKLICERKNPDRYLGFEVQDRLSDEMRENPPPNFEYVVTTAHDVRYNPKGESVCVPEGEFDTVFGKSWLTHVTVDVLSAYAEVFAERIRQGGYMIQTCFVDDDRDQVTTRKCLHAFHSRKSLENASEAFELIAVYPGGWTEKRYAPHDVAVWRRR